MADQKISALAALVGANVVTSTDVMPIVDTSASETKKILVSELLVALGISPASQAQMEQATSTNVYSSPGTQQYHPSAPKAWGKITPATTVSASYPAAGVSVVKNATGNYTVTHGVTFSSANYAIVASYQYAASTSLGQQRITTINATTFSIQFEDSTGTVSVDPDSFSYACYGDL